MTHYTLISKTNIGKITLELYSLNSKYHVRLDNDQGQYFPIATCKHRSEATAIYNDLGIALMNHTKNLT